MLRSKRVDLHYIVGSRLPKGTSVADYAVLFATDFMLFFILIKTIKMFIASRTLGNECT